MGERIIVIVKANWAGLSGGGTRQPRRGEGGWDGAPATLSASKLSEGEAALAPHMAGEGTPPRQPNDATTSLGTQTPLNLRPEAPEGGWIIRTSDEGSSLVTGEAQHDWNRSAGPSLGSKSLQRGKRSRELRRKRARRGKPQARRSEIMRQVGCEVSLGVSATDNGDTPSCPILRGGKEGLLEVLPRQNRRWSTVLPRATRGQRRCSMSASRTKG